MTEAQLGREDRLIAKHAIELRLEPRLEHLTVVRTLVGAIGTLEDLDIDAVADLRLAIDELCTQLIRSATPDATLVVAIDPRDDGVVVQASTACRTSDVIVPGSFSWHVLTSLVDEVQTFHDGHEPSGSGRVFGLTLTTRRGGALTGARR